MTSPLHDVVKKARNLAPATRKLYMRDLSLWINFAGEDPSGWTRLRAQAFYDHLLDNRGMRPQSANRVFASLRYASKWWSHFQNRPELDFAHAQQARGDKFKARRALERVEVVKLLTPLLRNDDPAAMRDLAIIVVMLETGMRRMSLVSMTIERTLIDDERLRETRTPSPLTWVKLKGRGEGADFPVPLSDTTIAMILPWRAWLDDHGIAKGPLFRALDERMSPRGPITTASKAALNLDTINKMIDRRAANAGIGHIFPHQFRHTFVSWRLEAGLAPHEVAVFTGHTVKSIGEMQGYIDNRVIAPKVRNSTPEWLRELVLK